MPYYIEKINPVTYNTEKRILRFTDFYIQEGLWSYVYRLGAMVCHF
jgi:hypothetical protein